MTSPNGVSPSVIDAQAVTFSVEAKRLLDRVDLQAGRGQFVGLIGPNGAGKSTLLRAISNVLKIDQGAISLEGEDLRSLGAKQIASTLALVPQIAPYTQGFTTIELVLMGRYPHLGRLQVEGEHDDRIAGEAMMLTETDGFAQRTLDTLSGGERQRVFIARALAQEPRVLLLDEPTSNLDILHQLKILTLVRRLVHSGLTAVAAIHDLNLAARFCDRLVVLAEGRLLAEGSAAEVLTPEVIEHAFGVRSEIHPDPATGALMVSLIAAVDDESDEDHGVGETASAGEAGIPRREESEATGVIS
ncbi:MAG: ABC transporter ATP-binding protein [Chloroflexi bacterium]|nr:ABC transporter ATP-binding protein [Chloroflexota bacterium]